MKDPRTGHWCSEKVEKLYLLTPAYHKLIKNHTLPKQETEIKMTSPVGEHFNSVHKSKFDSLQVTVLEHISVYFSNEDLLKYLLRKKESIFIMKYNTLQPIGLNKECHWQSFI